QQPRVAQRTLGNDGPDGLFSYPEGAALPTWSFVPVQQPECRDMTAVGVGSFLRRRFLRTTWVFSVARERQMASQFLQNRAEFLEAQRPEDLPVLLGDGNHHAFVGPADLQIQIIAR